MPKFHIVGPGGQAFEIEAPEGATEADVHRVVAQHIQALQPLAPVAPTGLPAAPAQPAPSQAQAIRASPFGRLSQGALDPVIAIGQAIPRTLSGITSLGGYLPNRLSGFFDNEAAKVDEFNKSNEVRYQAARTATGSTGMDAARTLGNVVSPVNLVAGAALPVGAATLGGRAALGAAGGALGGALQPVVEPEGYWTQKAAQVGLGGVAGGALGAVAAPVAGWAGRRLGLLPPRGVPGAPPVLPEVPPVPPEVPPVPVPPVAPPVPTPRGLDAAALARQADFAALNMEGTLGQVTRSGREFAAERNLRQIPGAGDPLLNRFDRQAEQLQQRVGTFGTGAQQDYRAGNALMAPLQAYDERLSAGVRSAYRTARESAGRDSELPMQGLAQDAAEIMDEFQLPPNVVRQLSRHGILPDQTGNPAPRRLFTVEGADRMLKIINKSGSRTDDAINEGLTRLRAAVKRTVTEPGQDDVFEPARRLAAERFQLHDCVDALHAVSRGNASPDTFVNNFILNADTDQAVRLADILRREAPAAHEQARAQIGASLGRAAFGQNTAGDKAMSVERYSKTLNDLGDDKLEAFFTPTEIDRLHRIARVGAYMNQAPANSPVNSSNNWGAITSLGDRIPGFLRAAGVVPVVGRAARALGNRMAVNRALMPPATPVGPPNRIASSLGQITGITTGDRQ